MKHLPYPAHDITHLFPGGFTLRMAVPDDPDAVLDTLTDEEYERDRFLPYWAEQWPSSRPLLEFLSRRTIPPDWNICELGSGLGIIAAALAVRTDAFTVATDIAHHGCCFTAYNIGANGGIPRVVCSDWRHHPFKNRFDALIASDVLYEERWIDPIIHSIGELLKRDGRAWIADPCRRFWPAFKKQIAAHGFNLTVFSFPAEPPDLQTFEILEISRQMKA